MRRFLAALALLCLLPIATAEGDGVQQDRLDLLNRAIKQVYAGAPSCKPPDPFAQRTTVTDAEPSAELLNTFAIFRRPATEEELAVADREHALPAQGIYRRYARIVTSASGRRQVVFPAQNAHSYQPRSQRCVDSLRRHVRDLLRGRDAAFKRGTSRVLEQIIRDEWAGPAQGPSDGLFLFTYDPDGSGGGGGGGGDVERVRTHGMFFSMGGSNHPSLITGLIPDGVASIALLYPATADAPAIERTVAVRENVVSYKVRRSGIDALLEPQMTWLAADGSVVRVVNPITYMPDCSNTGYLKFKPAHWSAGCMAGSLNMPKVKWQWWDNERGASATGEALLRNGCDPDCITSGVTRLKAKLVLSRPLPCTTESGVALRYFSRARFSVLYRTGNKLGERPGWRTYNVNIKAYEGVCALASQASASR